MYLGDLGHGGVPDFGLVCNLSQALEYCQELTSLHRLPKHLKCCDCIVVFFIYNSELKTDLIFEWIYLNMLLTLFVSILIVLPE